MSEVTKFYEFLVELYLPREALKLPPPEGWPNVTEERFAFLGKHPVVIDLLKHLPYIRMDEHPPSYWIYPECICNDYSGAFFEKSGIGYENEGAVDPVPELLEDGDLFQEGSVPPHIVTLAADPNDSGYWIFCDVEKGTMDLVSVMEGTSFKLGAHAFFKTLKEEYRSLALVPVRNDWIHKVEKGDHEGILLREIFRKHGWPTKRYAKDECLDGVLEEHDAWHNS